MDSDIEVMSIFLSFVYEELNVGHSRVNHLEGTVPRAEAPKGEGVSSDLPEDSVCVVSW